MPPSGSRPEHWRAVSTNLSGPDPLGQLKLSTYTGWARHVDPGTTGDDLLKLRNPRGDDWHDVLYLSEAGYVTREVWRVLGLNQPDEHMIGVINAYMTRQTLHYPNIAPFPGEPVDPDADWSHDWVTHEIYDANEGLEGFNVGSPRLSLDADGSVHRHDGGVIVDPGGSFLWPPSRTCSYRHNSVVIDLRWIRRHTTVPLADIEKIVIQFDGVTHASYGMGSGIISGLDPTQPPTLRFHLDDVTGSVNLVTVPSYWGGPVDEGVDTIYQVSLPTLPRNFIGPLPANQFHQYLFNLTGVTVAEFSAAQYGVYGAADPALNSEQPWTNVAAEIEISPSDLATLDHKEYVLYPDSLAEVIPGLSGFIELACVIVNCTVKILGPDT